MALILSIETATQVCSVAIHKDGACLNILESNQENAHARQLMLSIEQLLKLENITSSQLDAIAVSTGPGSYTGLRIGVSVAKGLAFALDKPVIAVDTLQALAQRAKPYIADENTWIVPMIDARRMEVYTAVLDPNMNLVEEVHPLILEETSFQQYLEQGEVHFLGDGSSKFQELIQHPNARFHVEQNSAASIGVLAYEKFLRQDFADLAYFEPNYLKEFRVLASKKNPLFL
ncbi:tRNA (adenosine(37)-N6)-threonylcarbamoyltransferase complex dimerization subunit type 1 TsaB [Mongoliitalea lutea]|uniref:tRNA (Adenosine(37)-N6)-threonylcarbamoyltransferase complex dimerization subunit type 1 TsaB n=1 Tax=Mongoliitalea lutea TaxID=849756 RepID=A0A8J3CZN8_9BACT|nr:tRNA (adenosine(37)-N6)-threonylcarbamoyltransferase complex dimerization subunit type 1 TsaB [Mongoliitalea lutea]GHB53241.1 tRNA (adenosine(37)-N6)-threonylcarbamoyltransferase complex dimerization subunit type 1 TsaB [Mongoliitalea lutea]